MATTTDELIRMKKKIDDASTEKTRLEGQLDASMKQLKELGFKDEVAANKHLDKLHEQIASLDSKIEKGVEAIKEEYSL